LFAGLWASGQWASPHIGSPGSPPDCAPPWFSPQSSHGPARCWRFGLCAWGIWQWWPYNCLFWPDLLDSAYEQWCIISNNYVQSYFQNI
jgi:hypothetical protein